MTHAIKNVINSMKMSAKSTGLPWIEPRVVGSGGLGFVEWSNGDRLIKVSFVGATLLASFTGMHPINKTLKKVSCDISTNQGRAEAWRRLHGESHVHPAWWSDCTY